MLTSLGFVIGKKNIKEYDREYCFFTKKYGKISLIAKSVRKPLSKLSGQLEPPNLIELMFTPNGEYGLITTTLARKEYVKIRKNLEKFKVYNTITDTIKDFSDFKQPDNRLWDLLNDSINNLNTLNSKFIEINFLAKFLKILGFSPNVDNCINCQAKLSNSKNIYFDKNHWGFCCDKCFKKESERIPWTTFKTLTILLKMPVKEMYNTDLIDPIEKQYQNIKNLLNKYLKHIKKYF